MELDVHLINMVASAIVEARTICRRPHLNNDRGERVGQFVVSLRRVLRAASSNYSRYVQSWCQTQIWADAGVLRDDYRDYNGDIKNNRDVFVRAVMEANSKETKNSDTAYRLHEMELLLSRQSGIVAQMSNVNDDADKLMGKFQELAAEL